MKRILTLCLLIVSLVFGGVSLDAKKTSKKRAKPRTSKTVSKKTPPCPLFYHEEPGYYTQTPSGLKYHVVKEGTGAKPSATDMVKVHYEGTLLDGTIFDSSYMRGSPIDFPLDKLIPGWTEGVQLMKEGAVYEFYIPYNLAYGERGSGPIPPKQDLLFTIELLKVIR